MHLIDSFKGRTMRETALAPVPFGAGFYAGEIAQAEVLEVHGSDITENGPDYCFFILKNPQGEIVATRRVNGY